MDSWELIAREAIRETLARYAHCADQGNFAAMVELFAGDGRLEIDGRPMLEGRAAIEAFLMQTKTARAAASANPYIRHHVSSVAIDIVDARSASASSYFLAITERGLDHWGRYRDRLVQVGDRWLFAHRRVRIDGRA